MGRLDNQVAVISGAAQGIGAAFAEAFAAEGAKVVSADIADSGAIVEKIQQAGGQAMGCRTDISDDDSLAAMVADVEAQFGSISVLVNNAALFAGMDLKPFTEITNDEWDAMMRINVRGLWQTTKAVLPSMRNHGQGKIINIASGTVHKGPPGQLHYVASKAAVLGLSHTMAREVAADNICVNCISPSLTMSDGVLANPAWEPFRKNVLGGRIIQREMMPNDLVGTALFLASSDSDFITGQSINVDGGAQLT